jgi:DNA-directed RNA polymerase subunit A'
MERPIKKQVRGLSFSLYSPEQIKKVAVAKIVTPELYDIDGYPVDGGLMDLRLGAIDPGVRCRTCGGRLKECLGHPGMIELARPIIHIKYLPIMEIVLKGCCEACGKVLLNEEDSKESLKVRVKKAKDAKKCPHCSFVQEKVKMEKPSSFYVGKRRVMPTEVRERLAKIADEDLKVLGINAKSLRPEWGVLTYLLVPPVTVRPSITLESGERSEDDLTHKLSDIIRSNQRLWENLNAGAPEVIVEDLWDLLQYHITTFFDNSIAKIPPARHRSGQPLKTINERIKGKEGRIRKNLAGKRVNFSARTVVSPDPNIKMNEVGVPLEVAKILTVSERVTSFNINRLKKLILADDYPKINYIVRPDGKRKRVVDELKEDLNKEIEVGYSVDRQLVDGDIVLFNRHPSLHKASLMAHFVKVLPGKTFRLHPAVCSPYNADFDGDEVNIHGPQTEEARAEASELLNVENSLMSPKNNTNLLGCDDDSVTGNYILARTNFDKSEASQLLFGSRTGEHFSLKNKNSGEELLASLIPKGVKIKSDLLNSRNLIAEEGEIVKELDSQLPRNKAIEVLENFFRLGFSFLSRNGFTISIADIDVSDEIKKETSKTIESANKKVEEVIESYYNKTLEGIPGKTIEEAREIKILQILNSVRTDVGRVVKENFPTDNLANKMISSGARGNMLNITQMSCLVGQQVLNGQRINFGYSGRSLSFFKKEDLSPRSAGFIESSFIKGLRPDEFFFGAMTGRDAMMDTALRTPKSGYLYRRLVSALQDLIVEYDGTVRDSSDSIVQFKFGGDGMDISGLHKNQKISPGEAAGIITAQSFGESSTQMVLNVFHSAGVAEVQVTQGLPRLIEILDARKLPSTPTMEIYLNSENNNEQSARVLAEKIKEVKLKEIVSEVMVDFSSKNLEVIIDKNALKRVHIGLESVEAVLKEKGFSVRKKENSLVLSFAELDFKDLFKTKQKIKETTISGLKGIDQVLVVKRGKEYVVLTAGSNLKEVMNFKGVNPNRVFSNNIHEIADILGIEAARQAIVNEISSVLVSQGLDIDKRHLSLVADAMTSSGVVKGVTRVGIISDKNSILARASFETPVKHFVAATKTGKEDKLTSVIENIILNQPVPVGTGLPGLLVKVTGSLAKKEEKK